MKAQISNLFYWCNNIDTMRHFYTIVLGLNETVYRNDDKAGWLSYELSNLTLNFLRATDPLTVATEWARQPGWAEGTLQTHSFIVQVSQTDFATIVARAQKMGVKTYDAEPRGEPSAYLQHFLMDPMGNSLELYYEAHND